MAFKTILLPRDQAEITGEILATGLGIARLFDAHLEVLLLRRDPDASIPFVFGSLGSDKLRKTVIEAAQQSENTRAALIRQNFDDFFAKHEIPVIDGAAKTAAGISASWREGENEALIRRGRLSDLIVVGRPEDISQHLLTLETALMETGRPVLMAPPKALPSIGKHIVICWNSSAEAARAVAAALPCLAQADTVTILSSDKRKDSVAELRDYLAWHNIAGKVKIYEVRGQSVGATLLAEAKDLGADMLVMGGYSHARARQLLFGGVTQHFIGNAELPVFMAH